MLEQERRIHSYPVTTGDRKKLHFTVHDLSYKTHTESQQLTATDSSSQVRLFTRGYINFESQPENLERHTTFASALDGSEFTHTTTVHYTSYRVDEVVQRLRNRLKSIDAEGTTTYASEYPAKKLRAVIEESLARIGESRDLVLEQNLQHAYRAIGNTQRRGARTVRIEREPDDLLMRTTEDMRTRSVGIGSLRKDATVFYDSESESTSDDADTRLLAEVADDDAPFPRHAARRIENKFLFKSPVNVVLTSHAPEREFVKRLFEPEIAERIDAWVKAPDTGFYEIDYSWRKGDHTKLGKFNPDVFIRLADASGVLVVELKDDSDVSDENRAKLEYATAHFERINDRQNGVTYAIKFVSPQSYDAFFQALKAGTIMKFTSGLQVALQSD